jgi:luciferase family oxidoreductase group 1
VTGSSIWSDSRTCSIVPPAVSSTNARPCHSTASLASPSPEILLSRIGAETSRIHIGSGATLLPHYAPLKVVEQFMMLESMYPGRVEIGIGRAPGGSRLDSFALSRYRSMEKEVDDFPNQLAELLAFLHHGFPDEHPFSRIDVSPDPGSVPDVWLLGSSGWSAEASAQLGLPYAAAHFIGPQATRASMERYYANFQPSKYLDAPKALVCVGAIVADTEEEAQFHASSQRLRRLLRDTGVSERGPIPTPEDAIARLEGTPPPGPERGAEWPRIFVGETSVVHEQVATMASELKVDELMLITVVHNHEARKRSYELMAKAFGIEAQS